MSYNADSSRMQAGQAEGGVEEELSRRTTLAVGEMQAQSPSSQQSSKPTLYASHDEDTERSRPAQAHDLGEVDEGHHEANSGPHAVATPSPETYELRTLNTAQDDHVLAPSVGADSFASIREGGALGKRIEALFSALKDSERRRSLMGKLDKLEDEGCWQSLKSAVDVLQEMVQSIPTVLPDFVDDPENEAADGLSDPLLVRRTVGNGFTLPFPGELAPTRVYNHQWAVLPSKVANIPCTSMDPGALLDTLNTIFDTRFRLTPGVEACLAEFIDDGCDLGQVYGYLRPWWPRDGSVAEFDTLPAEMLERRQKDYDLRSTAVTGNRITNPRIPPRRVWDLRANRVLPYHALKLRTPGDTYIFGHQIWSVSHSWRPLSERQSVLSTINGKAWCVPIPIGTTLNAIRDELLVLGADYVFLDVLCLRQKDEHLPEFESIRKREWRLDIPTIGHVYNENPDRPTIVYFNGLGLPFRNEKVDPNDQFHWFNRVWTLQESPSCMIIGGLINSGVDGGISPRGPFRVMGNSWPSALRQDFRELIKNCPRVFTSSCEDVLECVKSRSCANPVDQVACIAYLVRCDTLPIYDGDMDVEVAWQLLMECLPALDRTRLLFSDFGARRQSGSWQPTWEQAKAFAHSIPHRPFAEPGSKFSYTTNSLQLPWEKPEPSTHYIAGPPSRGSSSKYWSEPTFQKATFSIPNRRPIVRSYDQDVLHLEGSSPTLGYMYGFDAYYHTPFVVVGCRIHGIQPQRSTDDGPQSVTIEMPLVGEADYRSFVVTKCGDSILPDTEYVLVSVSSFWSKDIWVVAEVKGVRRINGEKAIELSKVSTMIIPDSHDYTDSSLFFLRLIKGRKRLVVWR